MPIWKMVNGVLRKVNEIYRFNGSSWDRVIKANIPYGGVIVEHFTPRIVINITSDVANLNIFSVAGSPSYRCDVILRINTGVNIYSTSALTPGLATGTGWAPGSTILIVNNGIIWGAGGNGGDGGYISGCSCYVGTSGQNGGDALYLGHSVTIDNSNGYIYAGGGGGGGGGAVNNDDPSSIFDSLYGGGGGGGGAGYVGGSGGIATPGDCSSAASICDAFDGASAANGSTVGGAGGKNCEFAGNILNYAGDGGDGGAVGSAGSSGTDAYNDGTIWCSVPGQSGGAPGRAVVTSGYSVTWLGGYNSTQVKGAVV